MRHMQGLVDSLGSFPDFGRRADAGAIGGDGRRPISAGVAPLAQGRRHVVDKMPSNFLYAGLIRLILPDARIIHCRRDPVDTCLSCYTKLFTSEQAFSYDLAELGGFHSAYQALMAHWRAALPASHFLDVDYEAVVADLEAEARRILGFLGLPWDDPACASTRPSARCAPPASTRCASRSIGPRPAAGVRTRHNWARCWRRWGRRRHDAGGSRGSGPRYGRFGQVGGKLMLDPTTSFLYVGSTIAEGAPPRQARSSCGTCVTGCSATRLATPPKSRMPSTEGRSVMRLVRQNP